MKKLTAGIFAAILTVVTVNAADAAIASQAYVAQEVGKANTAVTNLTNTVTANKEAYDVYVAQNDEDIAALEAKDGELAAEDTAIKTLIGTLPEGATATDVVGYINEKTSGIATDQALTDLTNRVTTAEGDIDELDATIGTVDAGQTVVSLIADAKKAGTDANAALESYKTSNDAAVGLKASQADLEALETTVTNLNTTYVSETEMNEFKQSNTTAINTAEQNAKTYADGLAVNYDAAGSAAAAQAAAISAAATDATIKADAAKEAAIADTDTKLEAYTKTADLDTTFAKDTEVTAAVEALQNGAVKNNADAITALQGKDTALETAVKSAASQSSTQAAIDQMMVMPTLPDACKAANAQCLLKGDKDGFGWELIERATDETPADTMTARPEVTVDAVAVGTGA